MKWNINTAVIYTSQEAVKLHKLKVFRPQRIINPGTKDEAPSPDGIQGEFILGIRTESLGLSEIISLSVQSQEGGNATLLSTFLLSEVFGEGPKIFKLGNVDFEALEATKINVRITDYNQPFRTIVFEYPDDYSTRRRVPCEQAGQISGIVGLTYPEEHAPSFCVIHHAKEINCLLATVYCTSSQLYSVKFSAAGNTIEECLDLKNKEVFVFDKSDPTSEAEYVMFHNALRAAFNAALLLDTFGCRKVGPENPAYYARLQRYLEKAQKSRDRVRIDRAIKDVKVHPMVYEIEQKIVLRQSIRTEPFEKREGGWIVEPHHRSGHWRMQPHGPERSKVKRIYIPPVFVNAHLFVGDPSQTKVAYTDAKTT